MEMREKIGHSLTLVKEKKPLVHHITNYVTVNDCANITLAIGGSPVMADDLAEVEEMVSFASALVINMGTLNTRTIDSMLIAGKKAKVRGIPVVFDPVGVGATTLRTETAARIIKEVKPDVIRGNMSEIKFLSGQSVAIKGVDSVADAVGALDTAKALARELTCITAVTGKQDIITDGIKVCLIDNGHPILADVTGTGCMTTSLVGTFCAAAGDVFTGTVAGITAMGLAGEIAQKSLRHGEGIGTFRMRLFDAVYNLTPEYIKAEGKIACD